MTRVRISLTTRGVLVAIVAGMGLLLIWTVRSILSPFVWALIVAYIMDPLVRALCTRLRLPRVLATILLFLGLIGGLDRATQGQVRVADRDLGALTSDELAEFRRQKVGFIFQSFNLVPSFTALENVCLPFVPYGVPRSEAEAKARAVLEQVGMAQRANHLPGELSGGEQQRVAIARALVNDPELLLADEPTGELDARTGEKVMEILRGLHEQRGMTILMTSHDPRIAEQAPAVVRLEDGRVVANAR